ncbi:MAG: EAL domain-containing protein [Myxococcales bacterium]|nr:EAL domain-containing protein [Myxococcales bacterium]
MTIAPSVVRPHLLLLQDSLTEAEQLQTWLSSTFEITHVTSVAAAVALLTAPGVDVALIDLGVDDSPELAAFLRCHEAAPHIAFVVQSGIDGDETALAAVAAGAQDYLVKRSFTAELVRRALRYAMERAHIESDLRESRERYRLAVAGANDGVWDWDIVRGRFVVSERWHSMLGYTLDEVGDEVEGWLALLHPSDRDEVWELLHAHLGAETPYFEAEHRILHADGGWRWVRTRGLAVRTAGGLATRIAGSQGDITERRSAEARLVREATMDGLTGLPNRSSFVERLRGAMARSAEVGDRGCAVLFLDLDRFKVVNDGLGHHVGDRLLVAVAQRLRMSVRPSDIVARFGGDEFALLVERMESHRQVEELAARIHRSLSRPFLLGSNQLHASASVGIVFHAGEAVTSDEVLRNADIAMYRSKRIGRGCTEVFNDADHAQVAERLDLENGLRRALREDELLVHYQPIVRLPEGSLVGFEALVRWRTPDGRVHPPAEFIPVAEETGLINELGGWVLRTACRRMAELARHQPDTAALTVSVNVSPRQFAHDGFLEEVEQVLAATGLAPQRLGLEITETVLMENPAVAAQTLHRIRALGVRVLLDDFGIGYSSLSYLRRFPIDCLKIDRAFTQSVPGHVEDEAIIQAILTLADALGLEVVAEGVESEAQRAHLSGLRCGFAQGFYFSHPLEAIEVDTAMANATRRPAASRPRPGVPLPRARRAAEVRHLR